MPHPSAIGATAALCALGLTAALAQSGTGAPVPSSEQRPAFADYRPFSQEEVQPWKETNDTVRNIGGWRAYAREMQGPAPAPAAPGKDQPGTQTAHPVKPVQPTPAAHPHTGHTKP